MQSVYFIDFDFTISRRDVWDAVVRRFAPDARKKHVLRYIKGEISSRECNQLVAAELNTPEAEVRELVMSIGVDPAFRRFVEWTEANERELYIVSDGYDYYIDLLLEAEGLAYLPRFSNSMVWSAAGVAVSFPHSSPDCERDMANCKCQHLKRAEGKRRVYVGDGISDACAAPKCECIYAKHELLDHCRANGIDCIPFESFDDVLGREEALSNGVMVQ